MVLGYSIRPDQPPLTPSLTLTGSGPSSTYYLDPPLGSRSLEQ